MIAGQGYKIERIAADGGEVLIYLPINCRMARQATWAPFGGLSVSPALS